MPALPSRRRAARTLAVSLLALAGVGALAQCPSVLVERFIPAECEACWREGRAPGPGIAVLDWIVPSVRGDEAALAAAALAEASARAAGLRPDTTLERRHALAASSLGLRVEDGPAWNGYMGLRLAVQRGSARLPEGAAGYLALVETLAAGDEGSRIARRLVRVLAGPLVLDASGSAVEHLLALRIPQGARGDRLGAVGWVQDGAGRVLAFAVAGDSACRP